MAAITIDSPDTRRHRNVIFGRVFDAADDALIQVLVLSADNRWYTQAPVSRLTPQRWACRSVLGFEEFTHPDYTIAVGVDATKVHGKSVANLPDDGVWVTQSVTRV